MKPEVEKKPPPLTLSSQSRGEGTGVALPIVAADGILWAW